MKTSVVEQSRLSSDKVNAEEYSYDQGITGSVEYSITPDARRVWDTLCRLDLTAHVAELEVMGYTVIPPEKVGPQELTAQIRDAILNVVERRKGVRPDIGAGTLPADKGDVFAAVGMEVMYLLLEDPVFQQAATNEAVLAIVDYMIGRSANITACLSLIKGAGGIDMPLHVDSVITPAPFSPNQQFANVTWVLTDYDMDSGPLAVVPGSHKYLRAPLPHEANEHRQPVLAKAGSIIIWSGSLWHGAYARYAAGLRMNLIVQYIRPHLRPLELYKENVTQEILDANVPRLATLVGKRLNHGWTEEGPADVFGGYNQGRHAYE